MTKSRLANYHMEDPDRTGKVKIVFTKELDWDRIDLEMINTTGSQFQLQMNRVYGDYLMERGLDHTRNASIRRAWIEATGFNSITFQLDFNNLTQVSEGGIEYQDMLHFMIYEPFIFFFKPE